MSRERWGTWDWNPLWDSFYNSQGISGVALPLPPRGQQGTAYGPGQQPLTRLGRGLGMGILTSHAQT